MKWSFIKAFPSLILLFISLPLMGGIRFSGLDLDEDNRLLFKAEVREKESPVSARETPGSARGTLFLSDLKGESISPLSAVSGKMELLDGVLWVRGAYGVQHIPVGRPGSSGFPSPALPRTAPGFPVFTAGSAPGSHIETIVPSGDGRWVLFVEPVSYARGNLALVNGESGAKTVIAAGVDNPGRAFPAVWSSDSRGFVYAKNRKLYYYPVDSVNAPPPERYRLIGEGTIDQIRWGGGGNFYYLRGSTVYRIRGPELFARTPYSNFLDMGEVAGTIPFEFDPNFDSFWIAGAGEPQPDGLMIPLAEALILAKGGRNIFCYILNTANASAPRYPAEAMPYLMLPRSSSSIRVLCSSRGLVTILAAPYGGENSGSGGNTLAYRINLNPAGTAMAFSVLRAPPSLSCALSPDGTKLCFWGRGGIQIYDYERWRPVAGISSLPASAALWASKDELITGGAEKIEYLKFSGADIEERKLLCLAGVDEAGFERRRGFIAARSGSAWYLSDGKSPWAETERPELKAPSPASPSYRVYLEQGYGLFENVPMVRNLGSVGTRALIPPRAGPEGKGPPAPVLGGSGGISGGDTEGLFSHGLRKYRKAALCFDLYDDDAGLSLVLDALDRFGVRATFFLNGEFIRRHPQAAREIAEAGHETASMFYAPIDLSDTRYFIDGDFITRGLARSEDEFFKATGKELALLWHPPHYAVSPEIIASAAGAGYKTVGRDADPGDWISRDHTGRIAVTLPDAADMLDHVMESLRGGSIIPLRLGILPGGRQDYLFNYIEVLLEALSRDGYELVTVSRMMIDAANDR